MTAIAYRDGIMASDSCHTYSNMPIKTLEKKILKFGDWVIGMAGDDVPELDEIRQWAFDGDNIALEVGPFPRKKMDFIVLMASRCGAVYTLDERGDLTPMSTPFMAVGSGALACLAAMERGASAKEAVEIACKWVAGCELPVHVEDMS